MAIRQPVLRRWRKQNRTAAVTIFNEFAMKFPGRTRSRDRVLAPVLFASVACRRIGIEPGDKTVQLRRVSDYAAGRTMSANPDLVDYR